MSDQMDIDALLDGTLDDLADLPAFKVFPEGAYTGTITMAAKKMGENNGVEMKFKCVTVEELADPASLDKPVEGDETSIGFMLNNEFGQGALKEVLKSLRSGLGIPDSASNREVMEQAAGATVLAVFKVRADKTDANKKYQGLKSVSVL